MKIKHFYPRIDYKMLKKSLDATYFIRFLKACFQTIFFLRNASTSTECRDVLISLKKLENWILKTSTCLVYDTIFKIDQTLFLKITNFQHFQNSSPYNFAAQKKKFLLQKKKSNCCSVAFF
jgi:hypothetical protein